MTELERAVREAIDWMDSPGGSPDSNELHRRWLDVLGVDD